MKTTAHKIIITLLCLVMSLMLASAAFAEGESVRIYDTGVITGFEPEDYEQTIDTEYKYALIVLSEQFPAQLTVRLGGTAYYQEGDEESRALMRVENYTLETVEAAWQCLEDYDEDMDVYHFVPELGEYSLAESVERPVITVNVLGKLQIPPMTRLPEKMMPEIPVSQKRLEKKYVGDIPSFYNGYEEGNLPEIRSQSPYNDCWAFATMAAVEADLIHDGNADTGIDLSELHLAYFTTHDFEDEKGLNNGDTILINEGVNYLDAGGNDYKASFALFNMLGPVQEATVPYETAAEYSPAPTDGRIGDYQITGYYSLYFKFTDTDAVKEAILDHGAVTASYFDDDNYFSDTYHSYYCSVAQATNHAVAIVGWNDNFSHNNFRSGPKPPGDGAWLIRNSWGVENYGHGGYFWLSYYDMSLDTEAYAFDVQPRLYDHVYSYDNCPGTGYYQVSPEKVSQSFSVDAGEKIQAIGFYAIDTDLSLRFTVTSGSSTVDQTFTTSAPGYYQIPLTNPLTVSEKSNVTVEYTVTGGTASYVPFELGPYEEGNGIVFNSEAGSEGLVFDGFNTGFDGRIKLFTNDLPLTSAVMIQDASGSDITGSSITIRSAAYQLKASASPAEALQKFSWKSSDMNTATVDASSGKVTFLKAGTATITVTATDGSDKSAFVTLTCEPPLADGVLIQNASGTNITGWTVETNTAAHQLKAAAAPEGALQNFTWTSSDDGTASVDGSGKVTFLKAGTVTITATATDGSGKSASVVFSYVPLATGVSIRNVSGADVTGQTITITGTAYQLNAAAVPADASQKFNWTSSDNGTATVDGSGNVTFLKAGTVTITAAATDGSGKSAAVTLTYVPPVPLATAVSILNALGADITGQTVTTNAASYQLGASAAPAGAAQTFTWASSDAGTATVDGSGNVSFLKAGTVTITATATDGSGKSASVSLTTDIKAAKVVIKNSSGTNITGKTTKVTKKTYQLKASAEPEAYASQQVTWKSSNTKVATVSAAGKVTFKKAGTVKITATAADGSGVTATATLKTDIKATKVTIRNTKGKAISHKTLRIKTKTVTVKAVAIPAKFAAQKFTWKTSDKKIATVKNGKVTFKKAGTVKITATAKDGSKKSNWVKITYKPASGKTAEPEIIETPVTIGENVPMWVESYLNAGSTR